MRTSTLTAVLVSALLIGSAGTVGALTVIGPLQPQQSPTGTTTPGTNVGTTTPGTNVGTTTSGTNVGTTTSGTNVGTTTSGTNVGTTTSGTNVGTTTQSSGPGITFKKQESTGETVLIESATLSQKGFVVIYDPTRPGKTSNKIIGVSYLLGAGTTNNIRIQLDQPLNQTTSLTAVIHIDSNNNGQFDYVSSNGQQDPAPPKGDERTVDIAKITVQSTGGQTQNDTGGTTTSGDADTGSGNQATAGGSDNAAAGGNQSANESGGDGSSGMFGPGFGFVVAVVALLGIALLAVRRN